LLVLGAGRCGHDEGYRNFGPNALAFDFPVMLAVFGACFADFLLRLAEFNRLGKRDVFVRLIYMAYTL